MTREEMNKKIAEINDAAKMQVIKIRQEFAESNAKFAIGDIIGDSLDVIRVERIGLFDGSIMYAGPVLKKDLKPKANGERRSIFEERAHKLTFHEKKS